VKKKSFCPIETLIILCFVAIVMGVFVPNFIAFQDGRRNQAVIAQVFSLQSAVEEYFLLYGYYPTNMSQLVKERLLVADGLPNNFSGHRSLPSTDNTRPEFGQIVYQSLDANKDGQVEAYVITAYGKKFGKLTPIANLCK